MKSVTHGIRKMQAVTKLRFHVQLKSIITISPELTRRNLTRKRTCMPLTMRARAVLAVKRFTSQSSRAFPKAYRFMAWYIIPPLPRTERKQTNKQGCKIISDLKRRGIHVYRELAEFTGPCIWGRVFHVRHHSNHMAVKVPFTRGLWQ